jgi:hypothetical protein
VKNITQFVKKSLQEFLVGFKVNLVQGETEMTVNRQDAQRELVKAAISLMGGFSATARILGDVITYQAVQSWAAQGRIPAKYVQIVAEQTGISKEALSPEVFGNKKAQSVS